MKSICIYNDGKKQHSWENVGCPAVTFLQASSTCAKIYVDARFRSALQWILNNNPGKIVTKCKYFMN